MALLRVSKAVEAEAAPILYGQNVWRVPEYTTPLCIPSAKGHELRTLWNLRGKMIKHVEISFDRNDIDIEWSIYYSVMQHEHHAVHMIPTDLYESARRNMEATWLSKLTHLKEIETLRTVVFDFDILYCPTRCCHAGMTGLVLDGFCRLYPMGGDGIEHLRSLAKAGMKIMVKGLENYGEKELVRRLEIPMTIVEEQGSM